uniref:Uncharacterized protein n=1 Tax=Heterorhabditis bacteriophora TaxID=37862 RepID=A0A1I7WDM6_HETBA
MPSGSSIGARVRASVSAASRKLAPSSRLAGNNRRKSAPTSSRAMWGTTRPTQPMMPASDTAAAVHRVAAAINVQRSGVTATPSALASSSPRPSRFTRQRSSTSGTSPISSSGAVTLRSSMTTAFKPPSSQKVMDGNWVYGSASSFSSEMPCRYGNAGQHQYQHWVVPAHQCGHQADQANRTEPSGKCDALHQQHRQAEEQAQRSTQAGTGGDAQNVRRHQRIAEHGLIGGTGRRQHSANQNGGQHAWQADMPERGLHGRRAGFADAEQLPADGMQQRRRTYRKLADRERQQQHRQQQAPATGMPGQ